MTKRTRNNKRKNDEDYINDEDDDNNDGFFSGFNIIITKNNINNNEEEENEEEVYNNNDEYIDCNNPECDHQEYTKTQLKKHKKIQQEPITITSIDDLITIGKTYHCKKNKKYYDIDLKILYDLSSPLTDLKNLVGMKEVKENIINHIIFFLQGFNTQNKCNACFNCSMGYHSKCDNKSNSDMMHTVITGPPGVGKTELGRILGKVYKAMGLLSRGHMQVVNTTDLIGKYIGHTAAKTQKFIDSCKGGVMFIDEAYKLGDSEGKNSFSKECLDILNQNMSERRDFLVIIAGYEDALEKAFFSLNDGLKRRFSFKYNIEEYNPKELLEIFITKINKEAWFIDSAIVENDTTPIVEEFFKNNKECFPYFGGDIETLFLNCKIVHARRTLFGPSENKRVLTMEDIKNGFDLFVKNRKTKNKKNEMSDEVRRMYL